MFSFEQADDIVSVLIALVERDEAAEAESRMKLLDKLVKWTAMEVEKATAQGKA